MKNLKISLAVLVVAAAASPAVFATAYYLSDCEEGASSACVPGNDSNAGTSPNAPWRTTAKIQGLFKSLKPGDSLLFARGASFVNAGMKLQHASASAGSPMLFADYKPAWSVGPGAKPILNETRDGAAVFAIGGLFNGVPSQGFTLRNLDLRGGPLAARGLFLRDGVGHVMIENLSISGFNLGIHSSGPTSHLKLLNSTIRDNGGQGFLGGGVDLLIEGNTFDNNGFGKAIFNHNVYITSGERMTLRGNTLTRSTVVDGKCQGVSLVVHGTTAGLVIENNLVEETAAANTCYGIAVDPGSDRAESFRGTIIRGNRVINVGGLGIGVASCPDCLIENNLIVKNVPGGMIGIAVPDRNRGIEDTPDDSVTVRNNSIFIGHPTEGSVGIRVGTEGANHVVVSNLVQFGPAASIRTSCFSIKGLSPAAFRNFDNNLCHFTGVIGKWESNHPTLASWQAAGLDLSSKLNNPMIATPNGPAYSMLPQTGSPAINAGNATLSSPRDMLGKPRGALPDMGAYESAGGPIDKLPPAAPSSMTLQ